ncbi:MAG: Fpg/Nei family DNA glycosylase [Actinomycetota bacterium]
MPELPDVERFRRVLEQAAGARIERVEVLDPGVLRDVTAGRLRSAMVGSVLGAPWRHGKWLIAPVRAPKVRHRRGDPSVIFHFGMTGELHWLGEAPGGSGEPRHRHDRLIVATAGGELRYRDMRKLQGIRLAERDPEVEAVLGDSGPDATEVTAEELGERLRRTRRQLKSALIDQDMLAGLGNLLVDEILWRSRMRPERATSELSDAEVRRLHRRMQTVLRHSVAEGRVPDKSNWLTGHRQDEDARCPRCGGQLSHTRVAGRHTVWCPRCQPR